MFTSGAAAAAGVIVRVSEAQSGGLVLCAPTILLFAVVFSRVRGPSPRRPEHRRRCARLLRARPGRCGSSTHEQPGTRPLLAPCVQCAGLAAGLPGTSARRAFGGRFTAGRRSKPISVADGLENFNNKFRFLGSPPSTRSESL